LEISKYNKNTFVLGKKLEYKINKVAKYLTKEQKYYFYLNQAVLKQPDIMINSVALY